MIRTYIKGFNSENILEPEDYNELPSSERSVEASTYKHIFDNEWSNWYGGAKRLEQGYWDDQDLVRDLISSDRVTASFLAVFCDEVQDFTRIELEFLFDSNLFSKRKMEPASMKRVPFAFVGDPFQTINPTGFRWEAVTSSFTEKYADAMRIWGQAGSDFLNRRQLQYNYRSDPSIVCFANYIQFVRMCSFNLTNVKPQIPWFDTDTKTKVTYFNALDADFVSEISRHRDVITIIPCEEGEEADFVRKDPYLRNLLPKAADEAAMPTNVMSPARVKGMEFDRVLLYGFGEKGLQSFEAPGYIPKKDQKERRLPYEYFLNKLYVAATRAKSKMYIVDSERAIKEYWGDVTAYESLYITLTEYDETEKTDWAKNIFNASKDQPVLLRGDVGLHLNEDPEVIEKNRKLLAEKFFEQGKILVSPFFMRQAAAHFADMSDEIQRKRCLGYAYLYEKRWNDAGHAFKQSCDYMNARDAFWEAENYPEVCALVREDATIADTLQYKLSRLFMGDGWWTEALNLMSDVIRASSYSTYSAAAEKLITEALEKCGSIPPSEEELALLLLRLEPFISRRAALKQCALICFKAKEYQKAVEIFESANDTSSSEYQSAKAVVLSKNLTPQNIASASQDILLKIVDLLIPSGSWKEIIKVGEHCKIEKVKVSVIKAIYGSGLEKYYESTLKPWIEYHVENGAFSTAIRFSQDYRLPGADTSLTNVIAAWGELNKRKIVYLITAALAQSELLSAQKTRSQDISMFLKRWYIDDRRWHDDNIDLFAVGSAIERAGKDIDALAFYESAITAPKTGPKHASQAKLRWLKCKVRQFSREKSEGSLPVATKHEKEFTDKMEEWGIDQLHVATLPEYPLMDNSGKPNRRLEDKQPQEIDGYTFIYNRAQSRIQVSKDAYSLVIILSGKVVKSMDLTIEQSGTRFTCTDWGLTFDLDHGGDKITVFTSPQETEGVELSI